MCAIGSQILKVLLQVRFILVYDLLISKPKHGDHYFGIHYTGQVLIGEDEYPPRFFFQLTNKSYKYLSCAACYFENRDAL